MNVFGVVVLLAVVPAWAATPKQEVVAYRLNKVALCVQQDGDTFSCTERLGGESRPPLPLQVLRQHPRGYVQVQHDGRKFWLDESQVRLLPGKIVSASNCTIAQPGDLVEGTTVGAGERCKPGATKPSKD
jgi:hypothetical protein